MEINENNNLKLNIDNNDYIKEYDVTIILNNYGLNSDEIVVEDCAIFKASDKMMGFLSDCLKLKIKVALEDERKLLCFFIKSISTNTAKATMVKELNLFEKEVYFYSIIKKNIQVPDLKPWSCKFVAALENAIVFEDLDVLHYKSRNKYARFDSKHTLQALQALARFHGSSIIFESQKSKELLRAYNINEDYEQFLDHGGYNENDVWFIQCKNGTLEAIKSFSKYSKNREIMDLVESRWNEIWGSALRLSNFCPKQKNVICHRDLWNNNIMFHYKTIGENANEPDDCVFVDFQAVSYQPPAGDVMLLLYCNLDPKFRENNMSKFLNYYYDNLKEILYEHGINIEVVLPKEKFMISAEKQRLWAVVVCACLMPAFWLDPDIATNIFSDAQQFSQIMTNDKASYIKKNMEEQKDFKEKIMEIYEEIIEKHILKSV